MRKTHKNDWKFIIFTICIAVTACCISEFWCQIMLIRGKSMQPAYHNLQFVLLNKRYQKLHAGDVVAFQCDISDALLVKRIVAEPKDTVWIANGILFVNGQPHIEMLQHGRMSYAGIAKNMLILAEDEFFVLGDNYELSKDSRYKEIGCIKKSSIIGRVLPNADIGRKRSFCIE